MLFFSIFHSETTHEAILALILPFDFQSFLHQKYKYYTMTGGKEPDGWLKRQNSREKVKKRVKIA